MSYNVNATKKTGVAISEAIKTKKLDSIMINLFLGTKNVDVNSTRSIAAIIYLAVVGPSVFIIQPGFVQGLVDTLGLSPEQAGYIASAEMWGLAATTIALTVFAHKYDWQKLSFYFLIVAVAGNLASIGQTDLVTLGVIRTITGLGLGGMISLPFAMMGLTRNPDRNFGFLVVWVLIYGALGLFLIPATLEATGMTGIYLFLAAFCGGGLLLLRFLPKRATDHLEEHQMSDHLPGWVKGSTLLGILVFNIAIGMVWAYLFLVGVQGGMGEQSVANVLTISQFLGVAGALLAAMMAAKYGRSLPLGIAIIGCSAGVGWLLNDITYMVYATAVYLFNFMWNVAQPYLLAVMASFADGGKMIVRGVCLQMVGFAVGPYIGANLLGIEGQETYTTVNLTGAILFFASWLLILPVFLAKQEAVVAQ